MRASAASARTSLRSRSTDSHIQALGSTTQPEQRVAAAPSKVSFECGPGRDHVVELAHHGALLRALGLADGGPCFLCRKLAPCALGGCLLGSPRGCTCCSLELDRG
jgi:hypothetical protein